MYLVCDGGGTKTEYLLFDETGRVYGYTRSRGTNALFVGESTAAEAVCSGICKCLEQAAITAEKLQGIHLFIPCFGNALDLVRTQYPDTKVRGLSDDYNAYYGALGNSDGIVVLAGTGSFAIGKAPDGEWTRAGGWGPLFGDRGSGYHIGIMCLERITCLYDRGIQNTVLQKMALDYLMLDNIPLLRRAAYQKDFTRDRIAGLSYAVASAAKEGDSDAMDILDSAAHHLAELSAIVAEHYAKTKPKVSLTGGLTGMGELLTERFKKALEIVLPCAEFQEPKYTPIVGAVLYVMDECVGVESLSPTFLQNLKNDINNYDRQII